MKSREEFLAACFHKYKALKSAGFKEIGPIESRRISHIGDVWVCDLGKNGGAAFVMYENGKVVEVHGGIYAFWNENGGGCGDLGFPVSDETDYLGSDARPGDRVSEFEKGIAVWRADTWQTEVRDKGDAPIDMGKEGTIGLVLSGGGAKGAFQAGVWKAMCQLDLAERVRAISGTSVGAINAAAFAAIRDPEKICTFWRKRVGEVVTPNFRALSFDAICRAAENVVRGRAFPFHGLLDRTAIEELIRKQLPEEWPKNAPSVVATTLECRGGILEELSPNAYRLRRFQVDEEPDHLRRVAKILASAAIPWGFDPVEIDGHRYVDGGWDENGGENVPVAPILEGDETISTLVVVRCNSYAVEPEELRIPRRRNLNVVEVRPSATLRGKFDGLCDLVPDVGSLGRRLRSWSGVFAFDSEYTKRFIRQGYADGMVALRRLRPEEKLKW